MILKINHITIIDKKINRVDDPSHYNYENIPTSTDDFKILDNSVNSLMTISGEGMCMTHVEIFTYEYTFSRYSYETEQCVDQGCP